MTLRISLIAAATLAALTAPAAFANDELKFDGVYGGIEAGFDWTKLADDTKRDGSKYYGGVLGYRVQSDSGMVFGLESTFGDSGYNNEALGVHADFEYSASAVFGAAFGGDSANLLYGKVGHVRTRFDATEGGGEKYTDGGWRFGGGIERAVSSNISLRLGADYTTYGKDKNQWQSKAGVLVKF